MADNKLVNYSIVFIATVIVILLLRTFKTFLLPFAIACIVTLLFIPLIRASRKVKIPAAVTIIGVVIIFLGAIYGIISLIGAEAETLDQKLPAYQRQLDGAIAAIESRGISADTVGEVFNTRDVINLVRGGLSLTGSLLSKIFLVLLFTIFLVPSYGKIIDEIERVGKRKLRPLVLKIEESLRKYLYTKSVISLGTGIASGILLFIFKSDFAVVLALLIFILNFIPNIGSIFAVLLASSLYLMKFGLGFPWLLLTILLVLVQIVFGNILEPKFAGDQLELSPVLIILSLFLWYWIWGIGGMMLAIPLTSIIRIILVYLHPEVTK